MAAPRKLPKLFLTERKEGRKETMYNHHILKAIATL